MTSKKITLFKHQNSMALGRCNSKLFLSAKNLKTGEYVEFLLSLIFGKKKKYLKLLGILTSLYS